MKGLRACGALIAGGDPKGLMLAIALAGAGRDVVLPFSADIPGNEYLPDNEIASIAFCLSQTMVLPKQLSVVKNPGEVQ
jgi:hypothetical protein